MKSSTHLVCITCLLLAVSASGITWHVNPDGSGDVESIQIALDRAVPGDIVELAAGIYYEYDLEMASGVTLRSADGSADSAIIDAQQLGRVLAAIGLAEPVFFEGLTFRNGYLTGINSPGAGVRLTDVSATFTACDFVDNYTVFKGGGLDARTSTVDAVDCNFLGNEGENGGGGGVFMWRTEGSFDRCSFVANRGIDGAGIYVRYGTPSFSWCTIQDNVGQFFGGGAFLELEASPTFDHCTIVGNYAHLGAGIMTAASSYPSADNCIIAFNTGGVGVHCFENGSYLDLTCCLVFGNEDGGYSGDIEDQTGINGNLADDPLFCDLEAGDLTVAANSPCLPENNDCAELIGVLTEGCEADLTGIELAGPAGVRLRNYPNPFNPLTTISFDLPQPASVTLGIYDLAGRLVCTLEDGQAYEAGRHTARWDGRDDHGRLVAGGTYACRIEAGSQIATRSMVLLK